MSAVMTPSATLFDAQTSTTTKAADPAVREGVPRDVHIAVAMRSVTLHPVDSTSLIERIAGSTFVRPMSVSARVIRSAQDEEFDLSLIRDDDLLA